MKQAPTNSQPKSEYGEGCVLLSVTATPPPKMIQHAWYRKKHVIQLQRCKLVLLKIFEAINYHVKFDRNLQYSSVTKSYRILLDSVLREIVSLMLY